MTPDRCVTRERESKGGDASNTYLRKEKKKEEKYSSNAAALVYSIVLRTSNCCCSGGTKCARRHDYLSYVVLRSISYTRPQPRTQSQLHVSNPTGLLAW